MVANNFLGLCKSLTTALSSFDSPEILIISVGDKEKKATSVPEINAEQINNKKRINMAIIDMLSIATKKFKKSSGSGSKCSILVRLKRANHLLQQ